MKARTVKTALRKKARKDHASAATRFFRTGRSGYASDDQFLGIRVPVLRKFARECRDLPLDEIVILLSSRFHEERLFALLLMVQMFSGAEEAQRKAVYQAYLDNTRYINNWDLVDASVYHILGPFLMDKKRNKLLELARSNNLWERRMSMVATYYFIRHNQYADTLKIARILLKDKEDLIHKAVGWMLREVGNRDRATELEFLDAHYQNMPRTMLRYAIEKFEQPLRKAYLNGTR